MLESLNGETLTAGQKVWAEQVLGCPGDVMLAEVIETDLQPGWIDFHFGRVCRSECVTVRQLPTAGWPVAGEPWVTYWPARKLLAV